MIRLTEKYSIVMDENNYILYRDYGVSEKTGRQMRKALGYFGRIQELLDYWAENTVKSHFMNKDEEYSLAEAVKIIKQELEECRAIVRAAIPDMTLYPDKS